jgi:cell division protein FtsZ
VTGESTAAAAAAAAQPVAPGRAGRVNSSIFEPADPASVPAGHTNGATVRIGGGDDGGISDDDVDVPPFMRH